MPQAGWWDLPRPRSRRGTPARDDAWSEGLYRDHSTAVYRYFVRRAPAADAEDLTAEVLATA